VSNVIGLDLSLKTAQAAVLDPGGELVLETTIQATETGLRRFFANQPSSLVVVETGGTSAWVARLAKEAGHEVLVAQSRKIKMISESSRKTDRTDALTLARLARSDLELLHPVRHRSEPTQRGRALLRVRLCLIRQRTEAVNVVRGVLRGFGHRTRTGSAGRFTERIAKLDFPAELRAVVTPLCQTIDHLSVQLESVDRSIDALAELLPVVELLKTVPGVGQLIATSFALCIEDPDRFEKARDVGAFLGLTPRLHQSGTVMRSGGVTKEGDGEMRRLLVQGAHVLLNCKRDSDLRRWGLKLKQRIGTKKATVAVARKLAVILLVMWRDGAAFEPLVSNRMQGEAA
jgi:transposase